MLCCSRLPSRWLRCALWSTTSSRSIHLPCPSCSLLRGADELGLRKAVKAEFGGGTRSFSCEEDFIYENVESEMRFFTSQVWQPPAPSAHP